MSCGPNKYNSFIKPPNYTLPWGRDRLGRRVKSAAGGNQANKLIQAAALMGAPSCTWQEAPAWAAPQQALH